MGSGGVLVMHKGGVGGGNEGSVGVLVMQHRWRLSHAQGGQVGPRFDPGGTWVGPMNQ